jgi:hypothetical protein
LWRRKGSRSGLNGICKNLLNPGPDHPHHDRAAHDDREREPPQAALIPLRGFLKKLLKNCSNTCEVLTRDVLIKRVHQGQDLARVTACRAVEVDDTPNYKWVNNKLEMIKCSALIDKAKVDRRRNSDAAHRH